MGKGRPICKFKKCKWKGNVGDHTGHCQRHPPALTVRPPNHDFGITGVGANSENETFTITNTGQGGDLVIGQVALSDQDYTQFQIVQDKASGEIIRKGKSKTIQVRFHPTLPGDKTTNINIPSNVADSPTHVPIVGRAPKVIVVISVDWDGHDLRDANITAFENFRNNAPAQHNGQPIPLTHFICASYFTGPNINAAASALVNPSGIANISAKIRRALRAQDEIGLHVHGWKSVVEGAGVTFTNNHGWWPLDHNPRFHNCWGDIGHDNPLTDYDANQVRDILNHSRAMLTANLGGGYVISNSFRSGGWVTSAAVRQGILDAGFLIDSSAVPANRGFVGFSHWHGDWTAVPITQNSQPYAINDGAGRTLKEVPDNCYLADYATQAEMDGRMQNWALLQPGPVLLAIGFH